MPGAAGAGARSATPPDLAASTSCAMTRPWGPEPAMRPTSRPAALASRRASGEANTRPARPLVVTPPGAGAATLPEDGEGFEAGADGADEGGAGAAGAGALAAAGLAAGALD